MNARITRQERLPSFFEHFPRSRLEIVALDKPQAPAAYYMQGTADGSRPGRFYANVSKLQTRPKFNMVALALHEGVPGHHHQGSLVRALVRALVYACVRACVCGQLAKR